MTEQESIDRLYKQIWNRFYDVAWEKQEKEEYLALLHGACQEFSKEPISMLVLVEGMIQRTPNYSFNQALHAVCDKLDPAGLPDIKYGILSRTLFTEIHPELIRRHKKLIVQQEEERPVLLRRRRYEDTNLF